MRRHQCPAPHSFPTSNRRLARPTPVPLDASRRRALPTNPSAAFGLSLSPPHSPPRIIALCKVSVFLSARESTPSPRAEKRDRGRSAPPPSPRLSLVLPLAQENPNSGARLPCHRGLSLSLSLFFFSLSVFSSPNDRVKPYETRSVCTGRAKGGHIDEGRGRATGGDVYSRALVHRRTSAHTYAHVHMSSRCAAPSSSSSRSPSPCAVPRRWPTTVGIEISWPWRAK